MATTATVNPRRRKPAKRTKRRPASYGAATKTAKRRRNPAKRRAVYSGGGYRRRVANPAKGSLLDFDAYMKMLPPATLGVVAGRFAVKLGGDFEGGEPTIKNAVAGIIGVNLASSLIGKVFKSTGAGDFAYAAGLGYLGELFLRKKFLKDSDWYTDNINLEGAGTVAQDTASIEAVDTYMDGVGAIELGETFNTAQGQYVRTPTGWQLAGTEPRSLGPLLDPTAAQLPGGALRGFEAQSPLGSYGSSNSNSFGYGRN